MSFSNFFEHIFLEATDTCLGLYSSNSNGGTTWSKHRRIGGATNASRPGESHWDLWFCDFRGMQVNFHQFSELFHHLMNMDEKNNLDRN